MGAQKKCSRKNKKNQRFGRKKGRDKINKPFRNFLISIRAYPALAGRSGLPQFRCLLHSLRERLRPAEPLLHPLTQRQRFRGHLSGKKDKKIVKFNFFQKNVHFLIFKDN